jgi:signal transduction histidine kinase
MCPSPNDPSESQPANTFQNSSVATPLSQERDAHGLQTETLLNAQAQAHEAYISSIAHDLKNPLTTIMGRVELMKRLLTRSEITPADLQRHLVPLEIAVQRLNALLEVISQSHSEALPEREQGR